MLHTTISPYLGALAITIVGSIAAFMIMDAAHLAAGMAEVHGIDVFAPDMVVAEIRD